MKRGEILLDPKDECGSTSPNSGRLCNHRKNHKGKCLYIIDNHVVEYWYPIKENKDGN